MYRRYSILRLLDKNRNGMSHGTTWPLSVHCRQWLTGAPISFYSFFPSPIIISNNKRLFAFVATSKDKETTSKDKETTSKDKETIIEKRESMPTKNTIKVSNSLKKLHCHLRISYSRSGSRNDWFSTSRDPISVQVYRRGSLLSRSSSSGRPSILWSHDFVFICCQSRICCSQSCHAHRRPKSSGTFSKSRVAYDISQQWNNIHAKTDSTIYKHDNSDQLWEWARCTWDQRTHSIQFGSRPVSSVSRKEHAIQIYSDQNTLWRYMSCLFQSIRLCRNRTLLWNWMQHGEPNRQRHKNKCPLLGKYSATSCTLDSESIW